MERREKTEAKRNRQKRNEIRHKQRGRERENEPRFNKARWVLIHDAQRETENSELRTLLHKD